jgi:hypothetical protein
VPRRTAILARGFCGPKAGKQFVRRCDASRGTFEACITQLSRKQLAAQGFECLAVHQLIKRCFIYIAELLKEPAARPDVSIGLNKRLIPRVKAVPSFTSPWPCVDRGSIAVNKFVSAQARILSSLGS